MKMTFGKVTIKEKISTYMISPVLQRKNVIENFALKRDYLNFSQSYMTGMTRSI